MRSSLTVSSPSTPSLAQLRIEQIDAARKPSDFHRRGRIVVDSFLRSLGIGAWISDFVCECVDVDRRSIVAMVPQKYKEDLNGAPGAPSLNCLVIQEWDGTQTIQP